MSRKCPPCLQKSCRLFCCHEPPSRTVQEGHKARTTKIKCWCFLGAGRRAGRRGRGRQSCSAMEWREPSLGGRRGTLKLTSSFVLSVGVVAFNCHPVPIPRHLLPVPVLFQVKFSEHRTVLWSHPTPGPVVGDPWVCQPFSHDSPVACIKENHRESV